MDYSRTTHAPHSHCVSISLMPSGSWCLPSSHWVDASWSIFSLTCAVLVTCIGGVPFGVAVSTLAGAPNGSNTSGFADGNGTRASFGQPTGVAVDPNTAMIYVADYSTCAIRMINTSGYVRTIAGAPSTAGGCSLGCCALVNAVGTLSRFFYPYGLVVHQGVLYISDTQNRAIRAMTLSNTSVTTMAGQTTQGYIDGVGTAAMFSKPTGMAFHPQSNSVLVADQECNVIRSVHVDTRLVTTIAGYNTSPCSSTNAGLTDGTGSDARFALPSDVAVDSASGRIYVADTLNFAVRVIEMPSGAVKTLAGGFPVPLSGYANGVGTHARFQSPSGVTFQADDSGGVGGVLIADSGTNTIRWCNTSGGVTTVAGALPPSVHTGHVDGIATLATFAAPSKVVPHPSYGGGVWLVAEPSNRAIRWITGNWTAQASPLASPTTSGSRSLTSASSAPTGTPTAGQAMLTLSHSGRWSTSRSNDHLASATVSPSAPWTSSGSSHRNQCSHSITLSQPTIVHSRGGNTPSLSVSSSIPSTTVAIPLSPTTTATSVSRSIGTLSQSCEPPLIEWHWCRYSAINLTTDYFTVALQPSAPPFVAVGETATAATWTSLALPLATLQRGSPFVLNLSSPSSAFGVSVCLASVVHSSGDSVPLVAADLVPQSSDATPPRFRLLKLSLPANANWVTNSIKSSRAAVTLSLVFSGCDNRTATTSTILVGLLPVPLMEQIPTVSSVVGSTTSVVSVTTATTAARVGAVRTLLLCTTTGASTGGLLGLTIARPDVDGDDNEVLPSARGAVVGNVVAVCVVGAVLCVVCCVYSARCGVSLSASALRLALPSSLLPVLVAVLPSTMGAVVYLSHSSSSKVDDGDVAVLAVVGALLCAVPLGLLAWIAFVLPSRLGLVVKPGKSEMASASSSNRLMSTLRWLHRSMSTEQWVWEAKESSSTANKNTFPHFAPERAGRIVLLEHRLLWFAALDVALVAFIAGLGVGSAFGGPNTCRASLIAVVVLLALETVLCAALKPFTTLRSQVTVVLTLGCTTVSAVLQLVAATMTQGEHAMLGSAALDLAVLGMATTRMILFDAPEMVLASWEVLREIVPGAAASARATHTVKFEDARVLGPMPLSSSHLALPLQHAVDVDEAPQPVIDEEEELDELFWGSDGRARALSTAPGGECLNDDAAREGSASEGVKLASELMRARDGVKSDLVDMYSSLGA